MDPIRRSLSYNTSATLDRLYGLKARLHKAEEAAATGRAVSQPQDAPELWIAISRLRAESYDQKNYAETAERGQTWLAAAETALTGIGDLLKKVKERAIQFSNEAMDSESRMAAANEMDEIRDELLSLANTAIDGRYVFAGTDLTTKPFDATGTFVPTPLPVPPAPAPYEEPTVQVGRDSRVAVGFIGADVFQGTVDVFQVVSDLGTALAANDPDAIRALIDTVQQAFDQNVAWTEEIGFRTSNIDDAITLAQSMEMFALNQLDSMVSADPAEAYLNLTQLQTTYESAIQVIGSTLGPNLFQYTR